MRLGFHRYATGGMALALVLATAGAGVVSAHAVHKAASGGTLVYALSPATNIPWYFPITNNANASVDTALLSDTQFQPLVYVNNSYKIDYTQSIASKITYNAQGTVFNVFMNPKWHWSDGQPITSADAQFSFDVLMATEGAKVAAPWPASEQGNGGLPNNLKSFAVDGPYEFTITLNKPANQQWFEYNGVGGIPILPKHAWDKYPKNITQEIAYLGKEATNPKFNSVVSGPFKLQSAVQNQAWTLVPNPNYDGHKSTLSRLIFQYEASNSSEFAGLKTGSIQVGYLPAADWSARAELPTRMIVQPAFVYAFTWPNMKPGAQGGVNKIFSQLYVRQALMMGMDDNSVVNIIYHGQGHPQYGPVPSVPKTVFADPNLVKPLYPYNPAAGKKLLEQHGWQDVNGVMTKGGQQMKFTLIYPSGDIAETQTQELLQAGWAQEGIQVTLQPTPFATLVGDLSVPSKWQMVGGIDIVYNGTYPTGETLFYKNQGLDENGWNDPTENALVNATITPAPTPQVNQQRFDAYVAYTAKEVPALFMPAIWTDAEISPTVGGFTTYTSDPVTSVPLFSYWTIKG